MTEFIKGCRVEVGAEFLHGSDTELTRFARAQGEPLSELYCWAHGDGGPLQEPVERGYGLYYVADEEGSGGAAAADTTGTDTGSGSKSGKGGSLLRYDDQDPEFQRLNRALWGLKDLREGDYDHAYSLADYLATLSFGPAMARMAEAGYANTLCSTARQLSLRRVIKWSRLWDIEVGMRPCCHAAILLCLVHH
jgi:hypothetical protein